MVAAGLAAALPIVVSTLHAVTVDWVPLGDNAYTAVRAFDVFTDRSPLVGQWSSGASTAAGELTYSPGPLLFWLLAIPARLPAESLMVVTMGLVNVACVVGAMALARRRGGWPLMLALAAALPLMLASLPGDAYSNIWNSSAALMPFTLLVFLCWSLACGEYRLLPLTVVVASLVAQTHLTFVGPAVGVTLVGLVGLALSRRAPRRWVLGSLAVALVCWSAPLIDQATNDPGNLRLLVRAATTDVPTLGSSAGWKAVVHMAGIPPWWLQDERNPLERLGDLTARPSALAIGSTLLVLAGLGAITIIGWRRRRPEVWAAGALGLVLCLAVGATNSRARRQPITARC